MSMLDAFADMHRALLDPSALGEPCTVTRGDGAVVSLSLFVDDSVQDIGQYGAVVQGKRVVSALNADWVFSRGDLVTARGTSRKVDTIIEDDGIANTAVLHG